MDIKFTDYTKNPKPSKIQVVRNSIEAVTQQLELLYNSIQLSDERIRSEKLMEQIKELQLAAKSYIKYLKN